MVNESPLPSFNFNAVPYRPDGGCSFHGMAILGLVTISTAIALGLIEGFLESVGFRIFIISAGLIGWGLGYFQSQGVKFGKVRSRPACAVLALMSGCIVFVCSQLFQFHKFEKDFAEVPCGVRDVARNFNQLLRSRNEQSLDVQQVLDELAKEQELRDALAVNSFFDYLDLMARRGLKVIDQ